VIGRLTGKLLAKQPPQIVVDVHGVGYELDVPMSTLYQLPATGTDVSLLTHLIVREDAHQLYGFFSEGERALFRQLLKISGVGARTALAVLSGMGVADVKQAVSEQDSGRLTKIPGIGKKTAERISLELRDKLPASIAADAASPAAGGDGLRDDLISALLNLGYQRAAAEKAVETVMKDGGDAFEPALKKTLRTLVKR
jgi:Holliday junction DNA helicase RuvA